MNTPDPKLFASAIGRVISGQCSGKSFWPAIRSLLELLRTRGLPLLLNFGSHTKVQRTFAQPGLVQLKRHHPSIEFKYLRTYIATMLNVSTRAELLCTHYNWLHARVPEDFFARIFETKICLWRTSIDDREFSVSIMYPHSLRSHAEQHDQEGDICLVFEDGAAAVYKLNFSIVPGYLFGSPAPNAALIACVQGCAGKSDAIKAAAAALDKVHPAVLLTAAAESISASLGLEQLLGIAESRQLCVQDGLSVFGYDKFWEDMGGQRNHAGVYVFPIPLPAKPMEDIKKIYRQKVARKRRFLQAFGQQIRASFEADLLRR